MKTFPCIIMDIDGTLANAEHRVHLLNRESGGKPDWPAFLAAAKDDVANPEIVALNNTMARAYEVIVVTGRSEDDREMTENWLMKFNVNYSQLWMRPAGDRRQDTEVKAEILRELREMGYEPLFAVEDRASVTKMWRENGVRCLQVCEGDY